MTSEPSYTLDDPRPIAAEAPYTYFLPSDEELTALAPGDIVKLIFRPTSDNTKWEAERMWVRIDRIDGDRLHGKLDNEPEDVPGLCLGDCVSFRRHHVISCFWEDDREPEPPRPAERKEYWERCLVDRCVIEESVPIHYLYREQPEPMEEGDRYEDSGWRIRGDYRGLSDEQLDAREVEYVAAGQVLNADDGWLHLVDAPIGSAFIRNWESGEFVPYERET